MVTVPGTSRRKGVRVGIALSATELCVAEPRAGLARPAVRRLALARMNGDDGATWPALADAFREISRARGNGGHIAVALMGDLAEMRCLELPPMRTNDLRQLLTRNASRYFIAARSAQIVGALPGPRGTKGALVPVIVAAAPARLVAAIYGAALDTGWSVDAIAPAEAAWAAAAAALWRPGPGRGSSQLLVLQHDQTELLELEDGRLVAVRRFRAGAADESLIAAALAAAPGSSQTAGLRGGARVAAIGPSTLRNDLARALAARSVVLAPPPSEWGDSAEHPDIIAAAFAGPAALPLLESDEVRGAATEELNHAVRWAAIGAVALFVVAALLELWGVRRELGAIRQQRSALRSEVAATLVGRTSVETAFRQLATLAAAQRTAPHWSAIVAGLSDKLGEDAYLTAFRGRGDSVVVDGLASHAARAFDAVEKTPGLTDVRAAAPVRREAPSGGPAMERFTIAAQVVPAKPGASQMKARALP
ncbi:MAG TPA: PilN domain-containing protein [Gemmatimonadaceae bacterium]|nr:PilN domain-containing protein [Gemmatimonadaceae bacterium]